MMYECRNRLGEKIGIAYTKQQAEEMIRHANWVLDHQMGTPEYERRAERARKVEERETNAGQIGLVLGIILLIVGIIAALS